MLEEKNHYAVDMVFPFVASYIDRSIGLETTCDLIGMNGQYTDSVNRVLADHWEMQWVLKKLPRHLSEIKGFKRIAQKASAPQCASRSYTSKPHLLDLSVKDLKRFGNMLFTDAELFEHLNVLTEQSYRMKSRELSTRMQETAQNMTSGVCRVQGTESRVDRYGCVAAVSKTR